MTNHTDTNQASEDKLVTEVTDILNNNLDPSCTCNEGIITWSDSVAIPLVVELIRTEKLKLLAEVRERVVGENQHSEHKEWDCPCGVTHSFTEEWHATNRLRDEQRAALTAIETKLETEL